MQADSTDDERRIEELLDSMGSRRGVLVGLVERCFAPLSMADAEKAVDGLQRYEGSVYSAANYSRMLEGANALTRVDGEGSPWKPAPSGPEAAGPDVGRVGVPEPSPVFWLATDAGRAVVQKANSGAAFDELLREEGRYRPVYKRLLELCSPADGASTAALCEAVDDDPLLAEPRFYGTRFVEQLERCAAIQWKGSWTITEQGRRALGRL